MADCHKGGNEKKGKHSDDATAAKTQVKALVSTTDRDENTSFFHANLKKRKVENHVASFVNENGAITNNFPLVVDHPGAFLVALWKNIDKQIFGAISDFFKICNMPSELHVATICLIPKHESPCREVDYRPIAYRTAMYKCISKLMCSRLSGVLTSLVSQNQGVFIKGRLIAHNVIILQDLSKTCFVPTTYLVDLFKG
ncbi:hypothetical protein CsatB_007361 [Cannabis sativa]|uniref:uncharacterized protein LOC133032108 n=1 Tax=Cannabis sativa TaxID=3483 RepID=UPI0029CAA14E|nr:uncharacterized protein LOC133032108 [Cannabis sativa]